MDRQPTVTVLDRGGIRIAPAVRLAVLTLAVGATVAVLSLVGLGPGERHTTAATRRAAPIPAFVGVRFDTRLDGDEGQPGGRRPDADDR